jgi:hypothetical protein
MPQRNSRWSEFLIEQQNDQIGCLTVLLRYHILRPHSEALRVPLASSFDELREHIYSLPKLFTVSHMWLTVSASKIAKQTKGTTRSYQTMNKFGLTAVEFSFFCVGRDTFTRSAFTRHSKKILQSLDTKGLSATPDVEAGPRPSRTIFPDI